MATTVPTVIDKPPPTPVSKAKGTKVDKDELFKTLIKQMQTAFKAPPRELMYQGIQEVILDRKKFTLSREVNDLGDYEYTLRSQDNNIIISCSFSKVKEEEDVSAHFKFEDKSQRISVSDTFEHWWRDEDGLVNIARELFRSRYTIPPLVQNGRGVKFDAQTLDILSRVQADQDDQLMGLAGQLGVALKSYVDIPYKNWEGIMPVRIDGKKFTLRMIRARRGGSAYILTSDDGRIRIFQGAQGNYLHKDRAEEYCAFSFNENQCPRGFRGDHTTNEVVTFNKEIVERTWKAFRQALRHHDSDPEYYSTNEYEWIDEIHHIAEEEGYRYSVREAIAGEFGVYTSRFIDREHVKVAPVYKEAKIMLEIFEETLIDILTNDRGAKYIGTTMGLTARYCLNGNLPVAQIPDFWRAAITYTNEILDAKDFADQITGGSIGELIPLTEEDPLSRLQKLCDIKPITSESVSAQGTTQIAKVPPNPFYRLMMANSPGEVLGVISSDSSLQRMFSDGKSSLSGSREPLDKILAQIPNEVSSLGLNYLRAYMGDERAFIDVAFRLLPFEHGLRLFAPIFRKIEAFMDREASGGTSRTKTGMRLHHLPNLPELFLILNNGQVQQGHDLVNLATKCITSIERFMDYNLEVDHRLVQVWARIGLLTHMHKLWKYDTQGGENSLFSKFGFVLFPRENKDTKLGASYVITKKQNPSLKIDEGTIFEFRRGYLLVSNPKWGTLIVRNSSLVFGRDLLTEPAYYSGEPLTVKTIKTIDSEADINKLHFKRILDPDLYKKDGFETNLENLLGEIFTVKEAYAKWRFFVPQDFENGKTFEGDLTPGMQALVSRMEDKLGAIEMGMSGKPLPVLGIFSSKYPPETPFEFYSSDLSMYTYLELTQGVIDEIKDRLDGTWNETKYPDSLWIQFIQSAVNHKGEIVLIDPPKKDDDGDKS